MAKFLDGRNRAKKTERNNDTTQSIHLSFDDCRDGCYGGEINTIASKSLFWAGPARLIPSVEN